MDGRLTMEVRITDMGFSEEGDMCISVVYKRPVNVSDVRMDNFDKVVEKTHLGMAVLYQ